MTMMANNNYYGDNDENCEGNDQHSGIGFPLSDSGYVPFMSRYVTSNLD